MIEEPCELFGNGATTECGGPRFGDAQEEGVTLKVCARHLIENRDYWMMRAEQAEATLASEQQSSALLSQSLMSLTHQAMEEGWL